MRQRHWPRKQLLWNNVANVLSSKRCTQRSDILFPQSVMFSDCLCLKEKVKRSERQLLSDGRRLLCKYITEVCVCVCVMTQKLQTSTLTEGRFMCCRSSSSGRIQNYSLSADLSDCSPGHSFSLYYPVCSAVYLQCIVIHICNIQVIIIIHQNVQTYRKNTIQ